MPLAVRRLLILCLKKEPKARLRDMGEARRQIEEVLGGAAEESAPMAISHLAPRWLRALPWTVAAVALAIAGTAAWRGVDRGQPTAFYASLDAPADYVLGEDDVLVSLPTRTPMVFTPDGRSLII